MQRIRARLSLYPPPPVNGDPGPRYECRGGGVIAHTKADPDPNLVTILSRNNAGLLLQGRHSDKRGKQRRDHGYVTAVGAPLASARTHVSLAVSR